MFRTHEILQKKIVIKKVFMFITLTISCANTTIIMSNTLQQFSDSTQNFKQIIRFNDRIGLRDPEI